MFPFYDPFFCMNWPEPFSPFPQNEYVNMITICKQKKSKSNGPLGWSNQAPDSKCILKLIENLNSLVNCSFVNGFSDNQLTYFSVAIL